MFQLIVAVVAIVLIAIMVIAALWWGGYVFTDSRLRAEYAEHMNNAAQIEGAMQLYYNDRATPVPGSTSEERLRNLYEAKYLKEIPQGGWFVDTNTLYKPIENKEYCVAMNRVAGYDVNDPEVAAEPWEGCPPCNGALGSPELVMAHKYKSWPGCQFVEQEEIEVE